MCLRLKGSMQVEGMFGRVPEIGYSPCWLIVGAAVLSVVIVGCSGVGVELLML